MSTGASAPRSRYGAAVLLGLATAGTLAFAGSRAWVEPDGLDGSAGGSVAQVAVASSKGEAPLATAVALVVLAAWGVLLVTRGRFRRAISWLLALAALGALAAAVGSWINSVDSLNDALAPYGVTDVAVHRTWWSHLGLAAAVLGVLPAGYAVRHVAEWPEMGRKYDAPGTAGGTANRTEAKPAAERDSLDLWKQFDDGEDPTA